MYNQNKYLLCLAVILTGFCGCLFDDAENESADDDNDSGNGSVPDDDTSVGQTETGPAPVTCTAPREAFQFDPNAFPTDSGPPAGVMECERESVFRHTAIACEYQYVFAECPGGNEYGCRSNDECTYGKNGICAEFWGGCECRYPCLTDSDCNEDMACLCAMRIGKGGSNRFINSTNECIWANCRTNDDCGDFRCGIAEDDCGISGLSCHTEADECISTTDCSSEGPCVYSPPDEKWGCWGATACDP
jgi:hypothetical protein